MLFIATWPQAITECTTATAHIIKSASNANSVVFNTWYDCAWVEGNLLSFVVEVVDVLVQHHLAYFAHGELVQWPRLR